MRQLLINLICRRYNILGLDECSCNAVTDLEADIEQNYSLYKSLKNKKITIEEYCEQLNDKQLIEVYDSQCCQAYR